VVQDTYGTADVLRLADVALPEITEDEVLVPTNSA
jgi:NADPH:quinone reductase-like Zn-dependent oxidoreductase